MWRMARRAALLLSALALVLAACAETGVESTTTSEDKAAITIEGFAFSGAGSVSVGATVVATNQDGVAHTWTSVDRVWDSGSLSSGDSFEFTFTEPGDYDYLCSIHPQMTGTITVEG